MVGSGATADELQDAMTMPACRPPVKQIVTSLEGEYPCDALFWNTWQDGLGQICKDLGVEHIDIDPYSPWPSDEPMCENRVKTPHTMCERCTVVLAKCSEYQMDPHKTDPTTKPSQQPHGKKTMWCNQCEMYVEPTDFGPEKDVCPYHQRVYQSEEGPVYMYDEFNQDGEEL